MIQKTTAPFLLPLLLHLAAGMGIMLYYFNAAAIRWEAVVLHGFLVTAFFIVGISLSVLLNRYGPKPAKLWCAAALLPLFSLWFVAQHITTFVAYLFWSDAVTITGLMFYIPLMSELIRLGGFNVALVSITAIVLFTGLIYAYAAWFRSLVSFFKKPNPVSFGLQLTFSTAAILCTAGIGLFVFSIKSDRFLSLRGEPFADAFRTGSVYDLRFKPADPAYLSHIEARYAFREGMPYEEAENANVIIIMMDAARPDHFSVYGYERPTTPFLDSLYTNGQMIRVEKAYSPCPQSECGITGMLSSAFYSRIHYVNYKMHEQFSDLGYDTNFFLSGDHSRVYAFMKEYYGDGITRFRDGFDAGERFNTDDRMLIDFIEELPEQTVESPPVFAYLHMMSTHGAGARYDEFNVFEPNDFSAQNSLMFRGRTSSLRDEEQQIVINNYDNGVLQADGIIREIFSALEERGILEDAIVVITSDHGEGLGDRGIYGHAQVVHQATIGIPLLIYAPGRISEPENPLFGNLLDIGPTINGLLNLPSPGSWEGFDLKRGNRTSSHHLSTFRGGNQALLYTSNDEILMLDYNRPDSRISIFNLSRDPEQLTDMYNDTPDSLRNKLKALYENEFGELP
ncbi:MAG: sulfatase-like hydrolase/transferase [Balneolia bacterium]|nr:sulfatase-like hydrolase/transferase [Balneolia bacterium]